MKRAALAANAEQPDGPYYSQALVVDRLVFISGQLGVDPTSGELVDGGVVAEARQVVSNLTSVLAACGCSWSDVVQHTAFVVDFDRWNEIEPVLAAAVGDPPPTCTAVGVTALAKGGRFESELIAILPEHPKEQP